MLTSDLWVLQAVKGFKILFVSLPSQVILPTVPVFPLEQAAQVREELRLLLEKGAVAPVSDSHDTQEEWPNEASNQPEMVERVGVHRTFQNEGNPNPEGHSAIRGLVCESGSVDAYFTTLIDCGHQ